MKLKTWLSAALLLAAAGVQAAGAGATGGSFLKVGVGAKALSMGSAASVVTEGANAINWNPGLLGEVKQKNMTASYSMLFQDESQGFWGYAAPLGGGGGVIGVGVNYLTVSNLEKRAGDTEAADSMFNNNNTAISLSYGRAEVRSGLSLGATLKYIQQKIDTQSDNAVAVDLGSVYKLNSDWTTAFVAQNLGSKIGPDKLPLTLKAGVATKLFNGKLAIASDLDWLVNDERFYVDLGADYSLNRHLAFRAGYQAGRNKDELGSGLVGFCAGIGLKLNRFSLDYAYVPLGDLGNTHRMTLGFYF